MGYELVLWICLLSEPNCDMHSGIKQISWSLWGSSTKEECEAKWQATLLIPDPPGTKSHHICRAVEQPL